jgi:hypothetical protein
MKMPNLASRYHCGTEYCRNESQSGWYFAGEGERPTADHGADAQPASPKEAAFMNSRLEASSFTADLLQEWFGWPYPAVSNVPTPQFDSIAALSLSKRGKPVALRQGHGLSALVFRLMVEGVKAFLARTFGSAQA